MPLLNHTRILSRAADNAYHPRMTMLQCKPQGHVFKAELSFGETAEEAYCPDCNQVVPTRKL